MKWIRDLYHWVLHWAETPYGPAALFVLAMIEASVFPVPPDALLIALALGLPNRAFYFGFICTIGSVFGGLIGYVIGNQFWILVQGFFFSHIFSVEFFERVRFLYQTNAFLSVFLSGFTPIPYKVFTVSAGVFDLDLPVFIAASALGRGLRFFLVAGLIYKVGPSIKKWIENYFGALTIAFAVLLVAGFFIVKFLLK